MVGTVHPLADLEARLTAGAAFTRADAERVLVSTDLVSVGLLGEGARQRASGDRVTFGRVAIAADGGSTEVGHAGELRIVGAPKSVAEAVSWVRGAAAVAAGITVTGFSLVDVLGLAAGGAGTVTTIAATLREAGLEAIAEVPVDRFASPADLVAAVTACVSGGLRAPRLTVDRASIDERLAMADRASAVQQATGGVRAFAPLPRLDPANVPSTGYDDVKSIAVARLLCADIPLIQVDWPLYGPKLAQVAIAFGANDIDGVLPVDALEQGPRRTPGEDIARQIRAASAVPAERDGRYELRS